MDRNSTRRKDEPDPFLGIVFLKDIQVPSTFHPAHPVLHC